MKSMSVGDVSVTDLSDIHANALGLYVTVLIAKAHQKHPATSDVSKKQLRQAVVDCTKLFKGPPIVKRDVVLPKEIIERIDAVNAFTF